MLYEIRNYHLKQESLSDYECWAKTHALPLLEDQLDVIGFWMLGMPIAECQGDIIDELGPADVTWIIRWQNIEQRNKILPALLKSTEWQSIFGYLPGGRSIYRRLESRFCYSLVSARY